MMKKKVLIPLLVAGMMVASVVALDSCKKSQDQQDQAEKARYEAVKAGFDRAGAPMVESVYETGKYELYKICPYCHDTLRPNVYFHWHAFGTPPDDYDWSLLNETPHPEMEPMGQMDCLTNGENFCPYSGVAAHDPDLIQFYMDSLGVSETVADWMTLARFHGHNISYVIGSTNVNGASGYHNDFHVGGGVPFWPQFGSGSGPNP